jgi:hypothetical protein
MSYRKYRYIYFNGCSHTAGGSLNDNIVIQKYKELYNIEWKNEREITYPKYVSDYLNLDLTDESQSGSGAARLIRQTYEYIERTGIENSKKTIFILQINTPVHRVEYFCKEINDYLIINVQYTHDGELSFVSAVEKYSTTDRKYDTEFFKGEITEDVRKIIEKYHDPLKYNEKILFELKGLFSYLEENDIEYFYGFDGGFGGEFKKNEDRRINVNNCETILHYSVNKKQTIQDDINLNNDGHPGYFAHQNFAKDLINFLDEKLKPTLWVFGDSFSETFKSHFKTNNDWAIKFKNYNKGKIPQIYSEILSKKFDFNLESIGVGGGSNYTIMDKFIDRHKDIKKNDVVIFNWTTPTRFRIASDFNSFQDIIAFAHHEQQNDDISQKTTEEIAINRSEYTIYWMEIERYLNVIESLLPKNNIYYWTWVKPESTLPKRLWSKRLTDNKRCLMIQNWVTTTNETRDCIKSKVDYLIDISSDENIDIEDIKTKLNNNKKMAFYDSGLNVDKLKLLQDNFSFEHFYSTDYKSNCFFRFAIKDKKYSTIVEETNGEVDDLHYGEKGHMDLAEDLYLIINRDLNYNQ